MALGEHPFLENEGMLEQFVERWSQGSLPKSAWTHAAHVAIAAYFTFNLPAELAFERIKTGILHFNTSVGTLNTDTSGYHETLTRFWTATVGNFVQTRAFASRFEAVRSAVDLFAVKRDHYKAYYGSDIVGDRRARLQWVEPDKKPLPDYFAEARPRGPQTTPCGIGHGPAAKTLS